MIRCVRNIDGIWLRQRCDIIYWRLTKKCICDGDRDWFTVSSFPIKESNEIVQIPMLTHTCPGDNLQYDFFLLIFPQSWKRNVFYPIWLVFSSTTTTTATRRKKRRTFSIKVVSFFPNDKLCIEPRVLFVWNAKGSWLVFTLPFSSPCHRRLLCSVVCISAIYLFMIAFWCYDSDFSFFFLTCDDDAAFTKSIKF